MAGKYAFDLTMWKDNISYQSSATYTAWFNEFPDSKEVLQYIYDNYQDFFNTDRSTISLKMQINKYDHGLKIPSLVFYDVYNHMCIVNVNNVRYIG